METTQQAAANVTGSAPLYKQPEPLNIEQHGKLGLKQVNPPWGFASGQHFVPLLGGEFTTASLSYPIIFAGDQFTPLAVMGINPGENLFFENDGTVRPDAYLPAYVRRYPFTVATDDALGRVVVCIDVGSNLIGENPDFPFFNEKGETSEYTQRCINFCQEFDTERGRTENLVALLKELDLFESREARHTPVNPDGSTGESILIAGYTAVSETKLNALTDEQWLQLRQSGALPLIYAHLISLNGWDRLIALAISKANARMETAGNA